MLNTASLSATLSSIIYDGYQITLIADNTEHKYKLIAHKGTDTQELEWGGVGITAVTQNEDYSLTLTFNDGSTFITAPVKGEKGDKGDAYIITEADKHQIADEVESKYTTELGEIKQDFNDLSESVLEIADFQKTDYGIKGANGYTFNKTGASVVSVVDTLDGVKITKDNQTCTLYFILNSIIDSGEYKVHVSADDGNTDSVIVYVNGSNIGTYQLVGGSVSFDMQYSTGSVEIRIPMSWRTLESNIEIHATNNASSGVKIVGDNISDRVSALESLGIDEYVSRNHYAPTDTINGYIHRDGRLIDATNFKHTNPIKVENAVIKTDLVGYSNTICLLCTCDQNGEGRNPIIVSTDGNTRHIEYKVDGVEYLILTSSILKPIEYSIDAFDIGFDGSFVNLGIFEKFGVIGDSYASGEIYFGNDTYADKYSKSWGQILARKYGAVCTNYSRGGLSTRTWLTNEHGLTKLNSSEAEELYCLALGINDYYNIGISYLGNPSDMDTKADSFYGNYARIIDSVKAHAPKAKIVIFTIAGNDAEAIPFNDAIINIAKHYGIPWIVQNDDPYFSSAFNLTNKVKGHPTANGYGGMASAFERLIEKCMRTNVGYFLNTFWD